jgi:hypothetical protein
VGHRLLKPEARRAKPRVDDYGRAYVAGNIVEGNARITSDNWDGGVQPDTIGPRAGVLARVRASEPYPHAYLEIEPAAMAYETVLGSAGATLPRRDAVDVRVIEMVRTGEIGPRDVSSVRATSAMLAVRRRRRGDHRTRAQGIIRIRPGGRLS